MKHHYISCFAALLTGSLLISTGASADNAGKRLVRKPAALMAVHDGHTDRKALQTKQFGSFKAPLGRIKTDGTPSATIAGAPMWGYLTGPDGSDWLFTQTFTTGSDGYYTDSKITVYDNTNVKQGEFTVTPPEGAGINEIQPYGMVTTNFFDKDESTKEILVYVHRVGSASDGYTGTSTITAYHLDGTAAKEFDGSQGMIFDASASSYNTYKRMLLINLATDSDGESAYRIDVIAPPKGYGATETTVEHSFYIKEGLAINSVGPFINAYKIDGQPYYAISHYEKPYYTGEFDDNFQMITTPDNKYVVTVYDKNYKVVKEISVPVENPENAYRMMGFGYLTDKDLTKGRFTGDDDFNFVITTDDYYYIDDTDKFTFDAYNGSSEKVKTICDNVDAEGILKLSDIEGQEEQWAFGQTLENSTQQVKLVNVPSCETAAILPSTINGQSITTTMDRYPEGGSYKYAVTLGSAVTDIDGNVLAQIALLNKDLTQDKIVRFNLGKNGIYFLPSLTSTTLNPYLFNTTDGREYVYLSYIGRGDGSSKNDTHLVVADSLGNTIKDYVGDDTKGAIQTASFLNIGTKNASMFIGYYNQTSRDYNLEFIPLPFEKFANGGDGTEKSPYLVSTLGDMQQMKNEPSAYYKQDADIDMSVSGQSWTPVEEFYGSYDGAGHSLDNLTINGDGLDNVGLFGLLQAGSKISNLVINAPEITVGDNTSYVGTVAGMTMSDSISSVHVNDAYISGSAEAAPMAVGGIVGYHSLNSSVTSSSFNDGTIYLPAASSVGGIVGETRTSTTVNACSASGEFTANNTLGGIIGSQGMNAGAVTNSHADVTLKAGNNVGGIAGASNRGGISNCYAEGTIEATTPDTWTDMLNAGGIVGSLAVDWASSETPVVSNNVAALSKIIVPESNYGDKSVNRIVGYTADCEQEYVDAGITEKGVQTNYADAALIVGNATVTDGTANNSDGESVESASLDTDFFNKLGFIFGETADAPWKETDGLPILYFETKTTTGINNTVAGGNGAAIKLSDGILSAEDAARIDLYSVSGQKVAGSYAASVDVRSLGRGIYIVVVTDNSGHSKAQKIMIK